MKNRPIKTTIAMTLFVCIAAALSAQTPEITEENYLKQDSLIWMQFERDTEPMMNELAEHPERRDSLKVVYDDIYELASLKNRELAIEYATTPSGFKRLFMTRLDIPKDRLRRVFDALPEEMRSSEYGKNILAHLDSEQIKEGDKYYDFEATTDTGAPFTLSSLAGKNILLLYGGLGCMGPGGRNDLNTMYKKRGDDLEIVVYCPASGLEELEKYREVYPCEFTLVSDFLHDSSPVKILYGTQATPTCFFIDGEGVVRMKTVGFYTDRVDELAEQYKTNNK